MTPFELIQWWYANNPRQSLKNSVGMDGAWIKRARVDLKVKDDEFQKLAVFGWGNEDQRVKEFSRFSIPSFVKEIPHLREIFTPGKAWCPPEEQRAERYAQGAETIKAIQGLAQGLVKKVPTTWAEKMEQRKNFYMGAK